MTGAGSLSERAIILAPMGRDAEIAAKILRRPDLPRSLRAICIRFATKLLREPVLRSSPTKRCRPPICGNFRGPAVASAAVVGFSDRHLDAARRRPRENPLAARLAEALGNVTFLERPFHPTTLASVVRTAIRGRRRQYEARSRLEELGGLAATLEERVAKEISARAEAEESLRQSQKMEAVGQLTGGIAHDFNNLLAAISGSLEMIQSRMAQGRMDVVDRYIAAGQSAVKRAAALTHRLLAFSRRQTLDPKPTNVNRLIAGMEELDPPDRRTRRFTWRSSAPEACGRRWSIPISSRTRC